MLCQGEDHVNLKRLKKASKKAIRPHSRKAGGDFLQDQPQFPPRRDRLLLSRTATIRLTWKRSARCAAQRLLAHGDGASLTPIETRHFHSLAVLQCRLMSHAARH